MYIIKRVTIITREKKFETRVVLKDGEVGKKNIILYLSTDIGKLVLKIKINLDRVKKTFFFSCVLLLLLRRSL